MSGFLTNEGKVKIAMTSPCCYGYVDLVKTHFFKNSFYTLQIGITRFPVSFEASLYFMFKESTLKYYFFLGRDHTHVNDTWHRSSLHKKYFA